MSRLLLVDNGCLGQVVNACRLFSKTMGRAAEELSAEASRGIVHRARAEAFTENWPEISKRGGTSGFVCFTEWLPGPPDHLLTGGILLDPRDPDLMAPEPAVLVAEFNRLCKGFKLGGVAGGLSRPDVILGWQTELEVRPFFRTAKILLPETFSATWDETASCADRLAKEQDSPSLTMVRTVVNGEEHYVPQGMSDVLVALAALLSGAEYVSGGVMALPDTGACVYARQVVEQLPLLDSAMYSGFVEASRRLPHSPTWDLNL